MTIKRLQAAAARRGIYFNGQKKFLNTFIGYGYSCFSPSGAGLLQADTLTGLYSMIMKYPKIREV